MMRCKKMKWNDETLMKKKIEKRRKRVCSSSRKFTIDSCQHPGGFGGIAKKKEVFPISWYRRTMAYDYIVRKDKPHVRPKVYIYISRTLQSVINVVLEL